ncbi:hypothetical protein, partial [Oceaniovalibus sp. ACAM 378]|uniref:hypothetical protein n=1 Tax=Oceaniovalibus sp. ACAM 378 TaxID=2599923 RepID=UPI0011D2FAB7
MFGAIIRFSTADFRSGEYPTSSSYPAHLTNRGKVEQRTNSLTQGVGAQLAFSYERKRIILAENDITRDLPGKYVDTFAFPDGSFVV